MCFCFSSTQCGRQLSFCLTVATPSMAEKLSTETLRSWLAFWRWRDFRNHTRQLRLRHCHFCRLPFPLQQILHQLPLGAAMQSRELVQLHETARRDPHVQPLVAGIVVFLSWGFHRTFSRMPVRRIEQVGCVRVVGVFHLL